MSWAPRIRTWNCSGVKARPVCQFPYRPTESLRPGSNGLPAVYKTAALPGELRRHRVLGAIRTHTAQPLMLVPPADLGYEDIGAAVRCRSGPPALRGRGRSRARRRGFRGWTRTSEGKGQGLAGDYRRPTRNRYGRRDSNSHTRGVWARGLCRWTTPAEPEEYRPSGRHSAVDRGASPRRSPAVRAPSHGLSPPCAVGGGRALQLPCNVRTLQGPGRRLKPVPQYRLPACAARATIPHNPR
jgi:hypothetical protein